MRAKLLAIPITLILICSTLEALGESADLADAEKIAWKYMTSLLRGDLEMSFSLMDPRVLDRRKADIVQAYKFAKKQGKGNEFKDRFKNIEDLDSILRLPAKQFFILLVKKDRENAPAEHLKAMHETVVKVIGSRLLYAETARVNLKIISPKLISDTTQEEGLILTLYGGQWKVVENAK
jgi:hypothetical protein